MPQDRAVDACSVHLRSDFLDSSSKPERAESVRRSLGNHPRAALGSGGIGQDRVAVIPLFRGDEAALGAGDELEKMVAGGNLRCGST